MPRLYLHRLVWLLACAPAWAGTPTVAWRLEPAAVQGKRGQSVQVTVRAIVPKGFHIYSSVPNPNATPTQFAVGPKELVELAGAVQEQAPATHKAGDIEYDYFEGEAAFTIPLRIAATAPPGEYKAELSVAWQQCSKNVCLIPTDKKLPLTLTVQEGEAVPPPPADPEIVWRLEPPKDPVIRGQVVKLRVSASIPAGFHIYLPEHKGETGKPTVFAAKPGDRLAVAGPIGHAEPVVETILGEELRYLKGETVFAVPVRVAAGASPGALSAELKVAYQLCSDEVCVDGEAGLGFTFEIADAPPLAEPETVKPGDTVSAGPGNDIAEARKKGLWAFLALAFGTGLGALLTPCVFPMIPITVSFFTKRKQSTRLKAVQDAGIYALGILGTFVFLGFVVSILMGASGITQFSATPSVNLVIAAIFVALALNLFGVFEIALPVGLLSKLDKKAGEGEGFLSILLMALVFSITSFTCTVPFIGFVMVSATQGEWLWPLMGMGAFAAAFALPFCLLAIFPSVLKTLPKSGGWLNSVKVVMGFLELAAAMKFLSNADLAWGLGVLTRELFLCLWIAIAVLATLYLLGVYRFSHDSELAHVGGARILLATSLLAVGLWLGSGLLGADLGELDAFVPPRVYPGRATAAASNVAPHALTWHPDLDLALAEAKASGRPVFVDFTGVTCVNCRLMSEKVFTRPDVRELLEGFARAELYTDRKDEAELSAKNLKLMSERFNTVALPYYVILTPDDKLIASFGGFTRDVESFKAFLKQGLEAAQPPPRGESVTRN
ncbi:MAG: protein-disulfide reductase DsbD family protein [Planctomycetota bacterium]|nr:protein-disulfide reductase DsbD family protein [Planctomycetota bacterium]